MPGECPRTRGQAKILLNQGVAYSKQIFFSNSKEESCEFASVHLLCKSVIHDSNSHLLEPTLTKSSCSVLLWLMLPCLLLMACRAILYM